MAIPKATIPPKPSSNPGTGLGAKIENLFVDIGYKLFATFGEFFSDVGSRFILKAIEYIEPELYNGIKSSLAALSTNQAVPVPLRDLFAASSKTGSPAQGILIFLASTLGLFGISNEIGQTVLHDWVKQANKIARPQRPDVVDLYRMLWRGAIDGARFRDIIGQIGWPEPEAAGLAEIYRPRLNASDLLEYWRRDRSRWNDVVRELENMGYVTTDIAKLGYIADRILGNDEVIEAYRRGELSSAEALRKLSASGLNDADCNLLLRLSRYLPSVSDYVRFAVREAYDDRIAQKYGYDADLPQSFINDVAKLGLSATDAKYFWRSHWEIPSPTMGYSMLHRGIISQSELDELLRVQDYPAFWRDKLIKLSYSPLTRVDVRRMYKLGILNRDGVKKAYLELGYNDVNAEALTEFTIKYEDDDGSSTTEKYRSLTKDTIVKAYKRGLINKTEAITRLQGLDYDATSINLILALADAERIVDLTPDIESNARNDLRNLIETQYLKAVISRSEAVSRLKQIGFTDKQTDLILSVVDAYQSGKNIEDRIKLIKEEYVSGSIGRIDAIRKLGMLAIPSQQQDKLLSDWQSEKDSKTRRLSEAQYRKAYELKIITVDEYRQFVSDLGYSDNDVEILVSMLQITTKGE
jgi:hypothetical protein